MTTHFLKRILKRSMIIKKCYYKQLRVLTPYVYRCIIYLNCTEIIFENFQFILNNLKYQSDLLRSLSILVTNIFIKI